MCSPAHLQRERMRQLISLRGNRACGAVYPKHRTAKMITPMNTATVRNIRAERFDIRASDQNA
jgi:hypothetical protein